MARKQSKIRELFLPLLRPKGKGRKEKITAALREAVWIQKMGRVFEGKCPVVWCPNVITVFDFQSGHNIPESKGGKTNIDNLLPICARCNLCMGDRYTIDDWSSMYMSLEKPKPQVQVEPQKTWWQRFKCF
jgi:5-methylcytosine-specific restriction endonuclease McrA